MTVKQFHRSRRMFAYCSRYSIHRELLIAPVRDSRSHMDWLYDVYQVTEPVLRGYADRTRLYYYSTADCQAEPDDWEILRPILPKLALEMDLWKELEVWEGTIPGEPGERWEGRVFMGKLGKHLSSLR